MDITIAKLQPTEKNYTTVYTIMDNALQEQLQEIMAPDWHLFKGMKGMDIMVDKRFKNFLRLKKYHYLKFKYALTPVKQEDFMKSRAVVYVALDKETKAIVGFSVWAIGMETQEHDILIYIYVSRDHRRQGIAKKLLASNKVKVFLIDEVSPVLRKLLASYY